MHTYIDTYVCVFQCVNDGRAFNFKIFIHVRNTMKQTEIEKKTHTQKNPVVYSLSLYTLN